MAMAEHLYALIMAGGGGTRLWPLSRRAHPKQMLSLFGQRTMFQVSVDRLLPLLPPEHIFVVTAQEQVAPLAAQVPTLRQANFIVEPMGRGTAACIGLSALHLRRRDPDAVMAVLTADHYIRHEEAFRAVLRAGERIAQAGYLVTLGIEPTAPATGYGYIRRGEELGRIDDLTYYRVVNFTEKPDVETAMRFLQAGDYAWNSGMFVWRVDRILEEIQRWMPGLYETLAALDAVLGTSDYVATLHTLWPKLAKQTVDYGIMEKAERVAVIPADLGWSDIGAWDAVMELHDEVADRRGNVLQGEVIEIDTENTMALARGGRLVVTIGVRDLIIVDTEDALLITHRSQSQRVREVVDRLRTEGKMDYL